MKNILLTIIAILLASALGFGVFAYFDMKDNSEESRNSTSAKSEGKNGKTSKKIVDDSDSQQEDNQNNNSEAEQEATPEMVDVLRMIDAGKNVNGIVDQEGNTWTMNPGIAVGYTNPEGERYSSGLNYKGDIDGTDFNKDYDPDDEEIEYAEEPDPEVIAELQEEIDNAGLQTEMEAKQKELDNYINSFPEWN